MTDKPVELDQHLGMAQKTTDLRRLLAEVAANERTFRATQDALKAQLLAAPAIKFTDNGEVCIKASKVNGWFEVAARDTGPGISHPDQVKLFHEFQQADSAITRQQGGTALGLQCRSGLSRYMEEEFGSKSKVGHEVFFQASDHSRATSCTSLMCWFSATGNDDLTTRSGGRRSKSTKPAGGCAH
jgi:signal transduction histidine kinase